jgi:flagellar biosynthesis protein FlhF
MQEALKKIKAELGPEALIIETRKVRRRGLLGWFLPRQLEVTAAVDQVQQAARELPAAAAAGERVPVRPRPGPVGQRAQGTVTAPERGRIHPVVRTEEASAGGTGETLLRRELAEVKVLLRRMMVRQEAASPEEAFFLKWRQVLVDLDIGEGLADMLVEELRGRNDLTGRDEAVPVLLTNRVARLLEPVYREVTPGRVMAFVGPTGVGKTTTLAKLAAQLTLFHMKRVALVTIDTYRIGAVEQLRTYAEIIGVPLDVVMSPAELEQVLRRHGNKDYVLIDSAGRPFWNAGQVAELQSFLDLVPEPRDVFLVLASNTKPRDLARAAEEFARVRFNKFIFTKVDETETLGAILNIVHRWQMPVIYVTDGQNVPDDIDQVYPKKLAKLIFRGVDRHAGSGP